MSDSGEFKFSQEIHELSTDKKYKFIGEVEKGNQYKIKVIRYDESSESPKLYMNEISKDNVIKTNSKLIQAHNPFTAERHFIAEETGKIIYLSQLNSSDSFKHQYPTLDSFKKDCISGKITRGGSKILDDHSIEQEYQNLLQLPSSVRVVIDLIEVKTI